MNPKPIGRPVTDGSEVLAYTATAGVSKPIPFGVNTVRLQSSTDCFIEISTDGDAPSATNGMFMKGGVAPEYFSCSPGETIGVIQSTAAGNLYITPIIQPGN